jgi:multidrug efflux pump
MGLTLDDMRTAISGGQRQQAKGSFDGPTRAYTINANDQLLTAQDYRDLIVAYRNGNPPVRLRDVAQGGGAQRTPSWAPGQWNGDGLQVRHHPQRAAPAGRQRDRHGRRHQAALLPELQARACLRRQGEVLSDRTTGIRASVKHVQIELAAGGGAGGAGDLCLFAQLRATVIASLAVPISLMGTLGVMYLLGYSLNNLSLMALTIATGFVVDDAIVMIENIARYIEEGEPPLQAALKGATQIGFTIISLTVSLIAVLIPLLFMGDVVGRLFHEFAITMAVAILLSAVVSLEESHGRLYQATGRFFDRTIAHYGRAAVGAEPPGPDLAGVWRHAGADGGALSGGAQRLFSRCKTRARCRPPPRPTSPSLSPPWPTASSAGRAHPARPGRAKACRPSLGWTGPTPRSTPGACSLT